MGNRLMRRGEIHLAAFPYGDLSVMKLRPVLLLTGPVGLIPELLVAYISSVKPELYLPTDIVLDPARAEHRTTHLRTVSVIRLHKLATIHASSIKRFMGRVSPDLEQAVAVRLRRLLDL